MVRSGRGCDEAHLQTLSGWDAWTSAKTDLSARSGAREGEGVRFAGGRSISHAAKAGRHPGRLRRTPRQVTEWLWKRILCCRHGAPLAGKVHPMWFRWAVMRSARKSHEGLRSVAKHGAIFRVWHGGGDVFVRRAERPETKSLRHGRPPCHSCASQQRWL